ncbi:hypothetical protein [Halofilum ochraceum]|uniref:hypothetical protein n=1 Tax=Halofilum ochraceum TaxID=1611323 RepID=UPI0011131938|nr:hypothetical protein [Halofilum ochraceum]
MLRYVRRILLICCLIASPFSALAGSAIVPFNPEPVTLPAELGGDRVTRAVIEALVIRGWRMTEINRDAGYIDAELPVRAHVGRVRVRIGDRSISFEYRESDNLDHGWLTAPPTGSRGDSGEMHFSPVRQSEEAVEAVHRNYLAWVNELARTIDGTLMLAGMEQNG